MSISVLRNSVYLIIGIRAWGRTIKRGTFLKGGKIFIISCEMQKIGRKNNWLKGQFALSEGQKKDKRRSLSRSDKWGNVL